jgi:hypothetical protein
VCVFYLLTCNASSSAITLNPFSRRRRTAVDSSRLIIIFGSSFSKIPARTDADDIKGTECLTKNCACSNHTLSLSLSSKEWPPSPPLWPSASYSFHSPSLASSYYLNTVPVPSALLPLPLPLQPMPPPPSSTPPLSSYPTPPPSSTFASPNALAALATKPK